MSLLAERLRQVRVLYGYTMENVADSIGVTKQSISKYETGKAIPTSDVLTKIIDFYELPSGYLMKAEKQYEKQSLLFYRRDQHTLQRELEDAKIRLTWYYEMLCICDKFTENTIEEIPHFDDSMSIEDKAGALRQVWGIEYGPIRNLPKVLMYHGISLFSTPLQNAKIDGFSQMVNNRPIIVLNQKKGSLARKNFSLAHELGHLVLHSCRDKRELDSSEIEKEADDFAANFLMPVEAFRRDIININVDTLIRLADKWGVSPQAVLERCRGLGFLESDKTVEQAHRQYLLRRLNTVKNYYVPEEENVCSIADILEDIDSDDIKREIFIRDVCFPIPLMRQLLNMPNLFLKWKQESDRANEIDGVQLTFTF